jgi:putative membrane protein
MSEPVVDYRFILANERTFLAWLRTGLALVAGGVALDQFVALASGSEFVQWLAIATIGLGALVGVVGIVRWRQADAVMHEGGVMRRSSAALWLGVAFVVIAVSIGLALVFVE